MNEIEIEKAIVYFEDAVKESDEIISDCSIALQEELIEQKEHFLVALEVMRRYVSKLSSLRPSEDA